MLVKLNDCPDDLVTDLKRLTGEATASKAVFRAAVEYERLLLELEQTRQSLDLQSLEVLRLREVIEGARSAAALLLERTGQGDLLDTGVPFLRKTDHFED